jgi:hypothetical protein
MRVLGFVGSGSRYTLPSKTHYAMVGLRKAKWSNAQTVLFFVNLGVQDRERWEAVRQQRPVTAVAKPNPMVHSDWEWCVRLQSLLPTVCGDDPASFLSELLIDADVGAVRQGGILRAVWRGVASFAPQSPGGSWIVRAGGGPDAFEEVLDAVRDYGLPAIKAHLR